MTTIYVSSDTKKQLPKRHPADLYPTERTLILAALTEFAPHRAHRVLDIAAGDGRWGQIAGRLTRADQVVGIEKRFSLKPAGFRHWYQADFLHWTANVRFDLIVSNPPFDQAEAIIRRAWLMLAPGGRMVMLLRLAFQAGVGRAEGLWQDCPLSTVGVCVRRPSFYGGGTNGTDYGIYVWEKDQAGQAIDQPGQWRTCLVHHQREKTIKQSLPHLWPSAGR